MKARRILSKDEIDALNAKNASLSAEFTVGRIVVQLRDAAGRHAPRIGWVTKSWPRTMIIFEDGVHCDMHSDLRAALQPIDRYEDDMDSLISAIRDAANAKNVIRKASYE